MKAYVGKIEILGVGSLPYPHIGENEVYYKMGKETKTVELQVLVKSYEKIRFDVNVLKRWLKIWSESQKETWYKDAKDHIMKMDMLLSETQK